MKIGIVGAGAVGGYFGGQLKLAGHEVVFISRGRTLDALKINGLTLETKENISNIKDAVFTDEPSALKNCQYIFFTVKSYDTETTAKEIKEFINTETIVITPQNGINNDVILSEILGKKHVIPALTKGGYSSPNRGYFKNTTFSVLVVDEYDGKHSQRLEEFSKIFQGTNIEFFISDQIQVERWKKYSWNSTFNIISAITRMRVDQMINNPIVSDLCVRTLKEIIMIAEKEGIFFNQEERTNEAFKLAKSIGTFKTSTLQDLENGKRVELEAFTGHILKLAKKHNLKVPINETLYSLLYGITERK